LREYADTHSRTIEIGTVGSDPTHLLKFLDIAVVLGANLVRTIFTQASAGLKAERENIRQVAAAYVDKQVYLAIENHEASSYLDLESLCREIDNEYVGVCLDTVNSLGRGEGVREVTLALMPYTKCLHVKDFTVVRHKSDMELTITGASAGKGKLDIPAQFALLKQYHPSASIILEQWTPLQADLEATIALQESWAEAGIAYLKAALSEYT
jgi:sugar phosphate isomerase/epimerase